MIACCVVSGNEEASVFVNLCHPSLDKNETQTVTNGRQCGSREAKDGIFQWT